MGLENNPRIKDIYKDRIGEVALFRIENAVCLLNESGKEPVAVDL